MKVKELIAILERFDQDLELVCTRYSDYQDVEPGDVELVEGVREDGIFWITKYHGSMPNSKKAKMKQFVHFKGN